MHRFLSEDEQVEIVKTLRKQLNESTFEE